MISFKCPGCQAAYTVSDERAGKSGKCPKCMTPFRVPGGSLAPSPSANPSRPRPAPPVVDDPPAKVAADEEPPRTKPARREEVEQEHDNEPEADERPRPKPRRVEPEDEPEADERPRKKAPVRDREADEESPPRTKPPARRTEDAPGEPPPRRKARRDDADEPPKRPARKPKVLVSAVDRALKVLRGGQFLDVLAFFSLVLVVLGYAVYVLTADKGYVVRFQGDAKENGILLAPLALPSLLLALSGGWALVGRLLLVIRAGRDGGSAVFLGTAFFALGRLLLGIAATALTVWLIADPTDAFPVQRYYGGPSEGGLLRYLLGAFLAAFYCGAVGEALALSGLALLGWRHPTTDQQRGRIAAAAAFYPLVLVLLFFLGLLMVGFRELKMLDEYAGVFFLLVFAALQVVQYLLVSRAYRFPLMVTDQTAATPSAPSW